MGSLRAGFDVVSRHVGLILLPAVLDIFLWLGPRLSVDRLIGPSLMDMFNRSRQLITSSTELKQFMQNQVKFSEALENFNLLSLFSRLPLFPIGVSSLFAEQAPAETPFGSQQVVEIQSALVMVGLMFLLVLAGWILGGTYFRWVSGITLSETKRETEVGFLWAIAQTLILSVVWVVGLMMLFVPLLLVFIVLMMISPLLVSGAVLIVAVLSFWLVVPLFFTPHGIFVRKQNAFYSIFTSVRMARFTLPTSGMFVLCVFLLTMGLNYLWSVPPGNSWMTLVGIGGHAFITTALLSASFVYYRDMNVWLQTVFERLQQKQSIPTQQI
jgi:hypothetical protein